MRDINEWLVEIGIDTDGLAPLPLRVTYQDPCHLVHGQGIRNQPRQLLRAIPGLNLVELKDSDVCCGSAGIYNLTHPEFSEKILDWKMPEVAKTEASVLVAPNPGCAMQIASGARERGLDLSTSATSWTCWTARTGAAKGRRDRGADLAPSATCSAPSAEGLGVRSSIDVLGVRVDDVTFDEAVALIERWIAEGGPHAVTTPNPEFVMQARREPAFRQTLNHAALNVPDGIGLCGRPAPGQTVPPARARHRPRPPAGRHRRQEGPPLVPAGRRRRHRAEGRRPSHGTVPRPARRRRRAGLAAPGGRRRHLGRRSERPAPST